MLRMTIVEIELHGKMTRMSVNEAMRRVLGAVMDGKAVEGPEGREARGLRREGDGETRKAVEGAVGLVLDVEG